MKQVPEKKSMTLVQNAYYEMIFAVTVSSGTVSKVGPVEKFLSSFTFARRVGMPCFQWSLQLFEPTGFLAVRTLVGLRKSGTV